MNSSRNHSCCRGQTGISWTRVGLGRFVAFALSVPAAGALADSSYHDLAAGVFSQNWSNAGAITANDDWSGVPSIVGHRGDGLTSVAGADPQTILADGTITPVDVNANQTNPNTYTTGGVAEFDSLADRTVALQGSTTARAPFFLLHLCSTGMVQVRVRYDLRDVDGSVDNAVQPVALHYRVGTTGNFVNVAEAFVADGTTGPNLATNVTRVEVVLPAAADDRVQLQVRIMTADAVGSDEWVGVDNIVVSASPMTTLAPPAVKEDGSCSIECLTRAGWSYQLQRSTNLVDWANVGGAFAGDGTAHHFDDSLFGDRGFWRVEVR